MKPKCDKCGSRKVQLRGVRVGEWGVPYRRFMCKQCGAWGTFQDPNMHTETPNVLLLDIEVSPMKVYVWSLIGNDYIPPDNIIDDWFVISWAAKKLYSSHVYKGVVTPAEVVCQDDRRIISGIWELMNAADVIVTFNGNSFDLKKLNTRFIEYGIQPPHSYTPVDLYATAKRRFSFSSNSLDYINKKLGLPPKLKTRFELWVECVNGNKDALDRMVQYNIVDVTSMEETYLTMRPWVRPHPNLVLLSDVDGVACPICLSKEVSPEGSYNTHLNTYQEYRCKSCGSIGRGRKTTVPKEKRKNLIKAI